MLIVATGLGCGGSVEIGDQPLAGEVGGEPWVFVKGHTSAFLSDDDGYFASLYAGDFTPCEFDRPDGNSVILSIPTEVGEYGLSLERNMTFVVDTSDGPENLIGTSGTIAVDTITADTITGGVHAKFDGGNEIDGMFSVTICPE